LLSSAIARELAGGVRADYTDLLPSALACFEDDFEACIAHLRAPVAQRRVSKSGTVPERPKGADS
jgi:hypothetical protein